VNATGGSGNGSVTVTTDPNEGYSDRTANITVRSGGTTKVLTVTQKKKNALLLTKEKFDVSFEGDTVAVEVKSNVTYTATIPMACSSWIRQVTLSKALETKTLHFAISPNAADTKREGMIIFKESVGTLCDTVHVYQTEKSELVLTKDTCLVASEGATVEVELRTNTDYEVTIPSEAKDWLTLLESKANRVDKITLEVQPNTAHDVREARVTIKDKNSTLTDTLYICQAQLNAIVLTQKRYEVPAAGQGIAVEVKSNVEFEPEITPASAKDWVILNPGSKALVTSTLNYTVQPNTTYSDREARIIIHDKAKQLADTVMILQKQQDALILNEHAYTVPAVGDTLAVEVQSNIDYEVTIADSAKTWISPVTLSKALTTSTLYFVIQPNPDTLQRSGTVILMDKNTPLADTITVVQAAKITGNVIYYTTSDNAKVKLNDSNFGNGVKLVEHVHENGQGKLVFNAPVTSIGIYMFQNDSTLTGITIPNSVKSIGAWAFYKCTGLTSITIPSSVKSIGNYAFDGCSGLTSITIPNSVTSIGGRAFEDCSGLTSITIPNSVTSIGEHAFYNCTGLTSVTIPSSVTGIERYTFFGCTGLTSITIPNSVTSIGSDAFSYCI